jgi:large subunit ribosomal protein L10
MNREQKAAAIAEIAANIEGSQAILAVDYRGISVPQIAELRAGLREADTTFKVVKNSLTERAADESGAEDLKPLLAGPTALAFVRGDVAMAAKAIADYSRTTQVLAFKGGLMDGAVIDIEQIRSLSRLPSRQVLYGQLVGVVASPVSGLVRSLGALLGGLAVALGQVREQREQNEGPATAPARAEAAPVQAEQPAAPSVEEAPPAEAPALDSEQRPAEEAKAAAEDPAAEAPAADSEQQSPEAPDAQASASQHETEPAEEPAQADDNEAHATGSQEPAGGAEQSAKED